MKLMRFVRHPLTWIGIVLSGVALAVASRGLHWDQVGHAIASANYMLLALGVALLIVALYVRAIRWATLFAPRAAPHRWHLFGALNVGYALNNLLPLRVGELGRTYLICQKQSVDGGHALSTIIVERTLDTITVVAILIVTLPFIDAPAWARGPALLLGLCFLGVAGTLAVASAAHDRAMAVVRRVTQMLPERLRERAERFAATALDGFAVIRSPAAMGRAAVWSAASWLLSALVMYVVMRAFGLPVPLTAGLFVMCATSLGAIVPSSPGYIGVFHAIAIESLVSVFGVGRSDAASFALVQHAILYLTPIALGAIYFGFERGAWQDVRSWASGDDEDWSAPSATQEAEI
jgi:hypothetical protein